MDYTEIGHTSGWQRPWRVALVVALLLVLGTVAALWHLRREAITSQTRELRLLSLALTAEIGRALQGMDEGLHAMQAELQDGRLPGSPAAATQALKTRAALMPLVQTLWLVDEQGHVLAASGNSPLPDMASFAPAPGKTGDEALAVSRPFLPAASDAAPDQAADFALEVDAASAPPASSVPSAQAGPGVQVVQAVSNGARKGARMQVGLAMRFRNTEGRPAGWLVASLPADALLGAFSLAAPASDARMAVFRTDGVRLAGEIVAAVNPNEKRMAQRLATMPGSQLRQFRDGSARLVALHKLTRYGLGVVFTRDLDVMLAGWRAAVRLASVAVLLLLIIIGLTAWRVARADRRHAQAQHALQAQQARASKLTSLGALAGAVAHDFNNVLAAIVGYGEMAQDAAPEGSAQHRQLDSVIKAAQRGRTLVERILTFSGGGARASALFELEPIVEEVLHMLAPSLPPNIALEHDLQANGQCLHGDPTQVFEAIMNLCTNAIQAMTPAGGTLRLQLQAKALAETTVLSHGQLAPGPYLALTISDSGNGISEPVMERLFEPFFTTRSAHSGTGLGLAVVHGVMTEFGGAVDVQSTPGAGASFTLYLPASQQRAPVLAARPPVERGEGQHLMVVDDDPALVALLQESLRALGYAPLGFTDSAQALQAFVAQQARFAAVITDEVMPGMGGTALTAAIRQHAPDVPILLLSGFGGPLLAARAAKVGVSQVLLKPVNRADLARALENLLA